MPVWCWGSPGGSDASLHRSTRERIAVGKTSGIEAPPEPFRPLRRRTVGERIGIHAATGHPLQPVIADGGRGAQSLFDVACFEQIALLRRMSPDAGVAIRLQLQAHRVRLGMTRIVLHQLVNL